MFSLQNFRVLKLVVSQIFVFSLLLSPFSWGLAPKSEISALAKVMEQSQSKDVAIGRNVEFPYVQSDHFRPNVQPTDVQGNLGVVAKSKKSPQERREECKRILDNDSFWEGSDDYENLIDNSGKDYTTVGRNSENKEKNHYKDIFPVDSSRVHLNLQKKRFFKSKEGVDDYINARYIPNLEGNKLYIATQAPRPRTMDAFWRMVWEQNTRVIGMVRQLMETEDGQDTTKAERYWPEKTGSKETYGLITITMIEENLLESGAVIHRVFQLRKKESKDIRRVDQYQYIRDVQGNPGVFAEFKKHDYAGYSGAVKAKKSLEERHEDRKRALGDDSFWEGADEYKNLTDKRGEEYTAVGRKSKNKVKNRYENVFPVDSYRVQLNPRKRGFFKSQEGVDDYINASYVPNLEGNKLYIATQAPMPKTMEAFWRMVWEQNTRVIGMIRELMETEEGQDTTKVDRYWPEKTGSKETYGSITITMIEENLLESGAVIHRIFQLEEKKTGEIRAVEQYEYTAWPDHDAPNDYNDFFEYYELVREAQKRLGHSPVQPTVIHCSDGCNRAGVFVAFDYAVQALLPQGLAEGEIPQAIVRGIVDEMRRARFFMDTPPQYKFLLKALREYVQRDFARSDSKIDNVDEAFDFFEISKGEGSKLIEKLSKNIKSLEKDLRKADEITDNEKRSERVRKLSEKLKEIAQHMALTKGFALMRQVSQKRRDYPTLLDIRDNQIVINSLWQVLANQNLLQKMLNSFGDKDPLDCMSIEIALENTVRLLNKNIDVLSAKKTSSKTNFEVETLSKEKLAWPTTLKELSALKLEKFSDNSNVLMIDNLSNLGKVHKVAELWVPFISTQNKKFPTMMKFVADYESHKAKWLNARSVANEESIKDAVEQNFKDVERKYRPTALNADAIVKSLGKMKGLELNKLSREFHRYFEKLLNDPSKVEMLSLQQSLPLEGSEALRTILDLETNVNEVTIKVLFEYKNKVFKELFEYFLNEIPKGQERKSLLEILGNEATGRYQKLENITLIKAFELSA